MADRLRSPALARRAVRKATAAGDGPCTEQQFRALVEYERLRADRNGSSFALLRLTPLGARARDRKAQHLADILDGRLRLTDEFGWWDADSIGVLLTDTGAAGAWNVVDDVCAIVDGQMVLSCQVSVYPGERPANGSPSHPARERAAGAAGADRREGGYVARFTRTAQSLEKLLVRPLPAWKRGMDILGSAVGLILASPLLALIAVSIKLTSRGPVFFRQQRDGTGGQPFQILKFRTMYVDAEARKAELMALNERDGPAFKLRNDPRVTWLGRFLRRTCLDELPQLWHVLRGEMTLVGPRPLDSREARHCSRWQRRRNDVTPGLTCIWQMRGRSEVSFDEWMRMDLRYVRSGSFWCDVKLILATLVAVVMQRASH
jgi:lipopolysaccharide/colanic/teichoic acid biosynthesis glycosyltransferase